MNPELIRRVRGCLARGMSATLISRRLKMSQLAIRQIARSQELSEVQELQKRPAAKIEKPAIPLRKPPRMNFGKVNWD